MKLVWVRYENYNPKDKRRKKRAKRKYILGLLIGQVYSKIHILETKSLSKDESNLIRMNVNKLDRMDVIKREIWLRKVMPRAYNLSYKTINKDNIEIVKEYEVAPLDDSKRTRTLPAPTDRGRRQ